MSPNILSRTKSIERQHKSTEQGCSQEAKLLDCEIQYKRLHSFGADIDETSFDYEFKNIFQYVRRLTTNLKDGGLTDIVYILR